MGGHGGLNILPQKRWNVYNRDNRLKVAQDEAKAQKQEDEARERHEQAEREHRHRLLLQRTAGGDAAVQEAVTGGGELAAALGQVHEHINFWKEEETKQQHPENEKQQRDELKRRGNPDFYTSDAKFDERFALAYGLTGEKPWYAQAQKPERPAVASTAAPAGLHAGGRAAPPSRALPGPAGGPQGEPLPGSGRAAKRARRGDSDRSGTSTSTSPDSSSTNSSTASSSSSSSDNDSSESNTSDSDDDSGGNGRLRRPDGEGRKRRRSCRSASEARRGRSSDKRSRRRRRSSGSSSSDSDSDDRSSDGKTRRRHRRSDRSSQSRSKSRSKSKSKSRSKSSKSKKRDSAQRKPAAAAGGASKSLEQLRAERLQREKEERMKQRGLLASTAVLPDGPPAKEFNSAFGYAAALKRRREQ